MFSIKEPILQMFDQIDKDDHDERIKFYNDNAELIFNLDKRKQHYFTFHYISSLYEAAKYEHVLSEIDPIIEYVFLNNINYLPERTYEDLLFKKSASFFYLFKYQESISIGEQLVGIHPDDEKYSKFLEASYRANYNFLSSEVRLSALLLIFCSAIISAIFWFISSNNADWPISNAIVVIVLPCVLAIGLLIGASLFNYFKSISKVDLLISEKRNKDDTLINSEG